MASPVLNTQNFAHALHLYKANGPPLITFNKRTLLIKNCKKRIKGFPLKSFAKPLLKDPNYVSNDVERDDQVLYPESLPPLTNSVKVNVDHDIVERWTFLQTPAPANQFASKLQSYQRFFEGILEMSRLQNLAPSIAIVLLGGWLGAERSIDALMRPGQVWIVVWCSTLINVASMLVNDVFDFRSGTDQANGKTSPLLRGQIDPFHVELVAFCLYGASMIGLCYLEPRCLRLLIGVVIIASYIYTPILKNITMVKNMVISGIISSSILVGALAVGGEGQLQNPIIANVSIFTFFCFLSRELLMDVGDIEGDKEAGVNTLAVCFGGQVATLTSSVCLATANALLITLLAVKAQAFAAMGTLILFPLHAKILSLYKELGVTKDYCSVNSIHKVVQQSMFPIAFGTLFLAFVA